MLNNTFVFGTISAGLIQINSPNVTIDTTGLITTNGMGYTTGEGPGAGSVGQGGTHAGGSYSSCSSSASENTKYYGNIQTPTEFGSGGGSYGNGGGAVFINSSFIVLNGIISADGQSGNDSLSSTGGSGGSIWLSANISGNGIISANGGSATQINVSTTNSTGGGSGGRISLYSLDSIKVSAFGGVSGDGCAVAAYGTVYVSSTNSLYIDGLGTAIHNSGLTWVDNFSYNVVALSYASVLMTTIQANFLSIVNSAVWGASENVFFEVSQSVIDPKSQVTVSGNVTFTAQSLEVSGSISASVAIFETKNISISGVVNVDGGGYTSGLGPGYGFSSENSSLPAGGGSFGGYSIIPGSSNANCSLGPVGNFTTSGFGSGGGSAGAQQGANGGGMIFINSVFLQIDGMVSADGNNAQGYAGGGSGGSVFIFSNFTSGVGTISANGGGSYAGGLGSGGRVYVSSSSVDVQLTFSAFGSVQTTTSSKSGAGAGTVYFSESDEILIANGVQSNFTGVSVLPDKFFSSIVVTNSAVVMNVDSLNCTLLNIKYSTIQNSRDFTYTFVYAQMIQSLASVFQMQNYSIFEVNMSIYMSYSTIYGSGLSFFVNNLNLDHSEINTDGKGYGPGVGPGAGQSGENNAPGGGAGYGANGMSSCGAYAGGRMYGNRTSPDLFGSGGGNAGSILGGSGGGLIKIISNSFSISSSVISANGFAGNSAITSKNSNNLSSQNSSENLFIEASVPGFGAGGGSGGSIAIYTLNLVAESFVIISANGGNGGLGSGFGGQGGGGGAGGRIFISSNNTNLKYENVGSITVDGGQTSCFEYSAAGSAVSQCQPGFTANPANLMQCVMCGGGYASADGLSCLPCLSGTYSPLSQPATTCTPCGTGTASPNNGSYFCTSCTNGYFANNTGSARCSACPAGSTSNYFYDACDPCPMGSYSRYAGAPYCTSCSANFYQNLTGQTFCLSCSYGYGSTGGAAECIPCGPGTYVSSYYGGCMDCQAGTYSSLSANVVCNECPMGQYEPNIGSSQCLRCPPGQYQSYSGSTRCYSCPAGRYSESYGSSYCTECDAGTYNPNQGASSCMYCKNTYQGASFCYDSSSSEEGGGGGGPSFLWWGVPLLLLMFIILPAVWCWRRRNMRASYQPIADVRPQIVQPQMPAQPQMQPQPYLPQIPPVREESNINNSDEAEQETEAKECIICCDAKRDTVLLPCGHIASCEKCTRALLQSKPQCPICRNAILSFVRMYSV